MERLKKVQHDSTDLDTQSLAIIESALPALFAARAPSGALTAAPRPTDSREPNYWFFWPRDASYVVSALTRLDTISFQPGSRQARAELVEGYLDFVGRLPEPKLAFRLWPGGQPLGCTRPSNRKLWESPD